MFLNLLIFVGVYDFLCSLDLNNVMATMIGNYQYDPNYFSDLYEYFFAGGWKEYYSSPTEPFKEMYRIYKEGEQWFMQIGQITRDFLNPWSSYTHENCRHSWEELNMLTKKYGMRTTQLGRIYKFLMHSPKQFKSDWDWWAWFFGVPKVPGICNVVGQLRLPKVCWFYVK